MGDCIESTTKLCIKCNINMALSDTNFICGDCFEQARYADNLETQKKNKWNTYAEQTFNVPATYVPVEISGLPPDNKMIFNALYDTYIASKCPVINIKGDPLSGKTTMAVLLLKSIFKADLITCCYYFNLLNVYKYDNHSLSTMLSETEYLCLDNVGCNEADAPLVYSVLNRRVSQKKPTIIVYDNGYKPEAVYGRTPANIYIKAILNKYRVWATKFDVNAGGHI